MSSAQTGGEWISLAPEVSLAGVPRGPKEGANVVVASRKRLGAMTVVHGGTYDVRSWGASVRRMSNRRASRTESVDIATPA